MDSLGVPMGDNYYVMNPYYAKNLASAQSGLNAADGLVKTAWENAQLPMNFGGLKALTSNALTTYTSGTLSAGANRAGAVNGTPTATYVAHKDTMVMSIPVDGFGAGSDTIKAGEIVEVTGVHRLNMATRGDVLDDAGAQIKWAGTVTADVTLSSGAGTLTVAGPAINEANGQYNTVDAAIADNDVITIKNAAASTVYQPNLFFNKNAFGLTTVKLPKLYSTDTIATTKDGMSIRVSKYADGDTNTQKIRFDLLPAFATFNPFFAGQGFGEV